MKRLIAALLLFTAVILLPAASLTQIGVQVNPITTNSPSGIYGIKTFPSNSNAVTVAVGGVGATYLLVSANPVCLTNCVGHVAGFWCAADITVSNSSAATYTNCSTIPNAFYVGANGPNQATNSVTIAAARQAFWHVETKDGRTNLWVTVEQ